MKSEVRCTFRARANASSNAILPIRSDARSVMRRVARASFPNLPCVRVSCFTYCTDARKQSARILAGCVPSTLCFPVLQSSQLPAFLRVPRIPERKAGPSFIPIIRRPLENVQIQQAEYWHKGRALCGAQLSVSCIQQPSGMESCQHVNIGLGKHVSAYLTAPNNAASHPIFKTLQVWSFISSLTRSPIGIALTRRSL